jgi:hypothetical protein
MAEEIQGGLSQAQVAPAQAAPQAPLSSQDMLSDYFQKVQAQDKLATQALNERRQKLLELTGARKQMFDPKMLRLSAALARPTKTGSFGESLGYAADAMADEQEKELARKQQELKLQMEIEQMMQSQGRQMLGQELAANIFKNRGNPAASGAPMSASVTPAATPPAVGNTPAMPPVNGALAAPAPIPAAPAMPAAPAQAPAPTFGLPPRKPGSFDNLDDDQLFALGIATPELAKAIETNKENQRKARETEINEFTYRLKELSNEIFVPGVGNIKVPANVAKEVQGTENMKDLERVFKKNNLPWNVITEKNGTQRFMTPNELTQQAEEGKAKLNEKIDKYTIPELGRGQYELLPSEYREYRKAKAEGKDALQQWFNSSHPEFGVSIPGAKKVKPTGEATGVESVGTREAREKSDITFGEETAKTAANKAQAVIAAGDTARDRSLLADDLYKMASNPKYNKAFAILEKATPESALGKLISEGISVGSFKVGVPQLREVVIQAGGTEQDVESFRRLGNIYTQLMFSNGNLMKGEGAISDYERKMLSEMAGSVADTPKIAMARAEYLKMRANFDRQASNMYQRWMESHPNKSFNQFKLDNPQYDTLENNYINKVKEIGNKYFPNISTGEAAAPRRAAPPSSTQPAEGRQLPASSTVYRPVWDPAKGDWK